MCVCVCVCVLPLPRRESDLGSVDQLSFLAPNHHQYLCGCIREKPFLQVVNFEVTFIHVFVFCRSGTYVLRMFLCVLRRE